MKKILILLMAVGLFASCDPIEDRLDIGSSITADQLEATVTVVKEDGANVNYVLCECSSPVSCQWTNGILVKQSNYAELLMFFPGEHTITLNALCADGTELTKEFNVTVDEISENYPLPDEYGYFTDEDEKVWVWDEYAPDAAPWGNGGYMGDVGPSWWKVGLDDLEGQAVEKGVPGEGKDGSMTFILAGLKVEKSTGESGNFDFDMTKKAKDGWDKGTLYTSGISVLLGVQPNLEGHPSIHEYSILRLNEKELWLCAPEPGSGEWGAAWFWCFRAEGTTPDPEE